MAEYKGIPMKPDMFDHLKGASTGVRNMDYNWRDISLYAQHGAKVIKDLCESIGYDRDSKFYRAHGLIIGWIGQAQVLAFCVCTVTVCATAIATRAACATMSLVYCPDGIDYKGTALYSIALCAVMVVVSALVLVPLGSGIFAGIV